MSEFLSSKQIQEIQEEAHIEGDLLWQDLLYTCKKLREALAQHHKGKKFCRKCLIHVTGEKET